MNQELETLLKKRDRKKYLEELVGLENEVVSVQNRIFWMTLNLLIINPLITFGMGYYFWDKIKTAFKSGSSISNWEEFFSNVKWASLGLALIFTINSITLLYYLWRLSSLKSEITKIRSKIYRLEK